MLRVPWGEVTKEVGRNLACKLTRMKELIPVDAFHALDVRIGTVVHAAPFEGARKPAHLLLIDFGPEIGTLKSSAQITERYAPADLLGRQVAAVVNFPAKQIGPLRSQCLVLGATPEAGGVVLLQPGDAVPNVTPVA